MKRPPPRKTRTGLVKKWPDLMATNGQFYWPSVGNSVAAYGQFFMAADTQLRRPVWARGVGSRDQTSKVRSR